MEWDLNRAAIRKDNSDVWAGTIHVEIWMSGEEGMRMLERRSDFSHHKRVFGHSTFWHERPLPASMNPDVIFSESFRSFFFIYCLLMPVLVQIAP